MNKYSGKPNLINPSISDKQSSEFSKLNKDALKLSSELKKEAKNIGRKLYLDKKYPLFEVVDYYISHPSTTDWWRPIISNYMKRYSRDVINDINHRNKTRKYRSG